MKKFGINQRRQQLRKTYWPNAEAWLGPQEKSGWFSGSRTLPLMLDLLDSKAVSGGHQPSKTYLELLSRHWGQGVIEMKHEGQHAYAAGHHSNRALRTWREHMQVLEDQGFIKVVGIGGQKYAYVLLVHPTTVVEQLRIAKKITDPKWLTAYQEVQRESKEVSFEERRKAKLADTAKVVPIKQSPKKKGASSA
jgi:hypothetical protein